MTKRYFYTDPLAAAWMAKHFGMFFIHPYDGDAFCDEAVAGWGISPVYIHPDSLHLLESQVGDLIHVVTYCLDDEPYDHHAIVYRDEQRVKDAEVVQRNGIAFHWPECEA